MKIRFVGEVEFDEAPDDRGSIDNWLVRAIEEAVENGADTETGLEVLHILKLSWEVL